MDAGEAEASAPGRGRQTAPTKSRNSKELPRSERTPEAASKPVSDKAGEWVVGRKAGLGRDKWDPHSALQMTSREVPRPLLLEEFDNQKYWVRNPET